MSKPTPGPWRRADRVSRGSRIWSPVVTDERGSTSATVIAEVRRKQDADLIAAAPEMLQALRVAASALLSVDEFAAHEVVCAAIAKATGEA